MDFLFGNLNIAKIYMKNFRPKINNNKMEEAKYNPLILTNKVCVQNQKKILLLCK